MATTTQLPLAAIPIPSPAPNPGDLMAHLAPGSSGIDPQSVINAQEAHLADYLNQPVHDILARLGLPPLPGAAPPASAPGIGTPDGAPASPIDPSQLIQPVTDALGTLGSGQFGDSDPTQMFQGISQALESAGQSVQQALSSLGGGWQGNAANAAGTQTTATLGDGQKVASQATDLHASLSSAVASVAQAQARLMEIINEFAAKMAAIGPNIIFPWGMAAAIEAANEAITSTAEVMSETQTALGAQAQQTTAAGVPVNMSHAPQVGMDSAAIGGPASAASSASAPALGQLLEPMMQIGMSLMSPAMEGVSAITSAVKPGTPNTPGLGGATGVNDVAPDGIPGAAVPGGAGGGGVGAGGGGVGPAGTISARLAAPQGFTADNTIPPTSETAAPRPMPTGMAGGPMGGAMGGAGARSSTNGSHTAASFLHTTDQGDELVGDLGSVAPPVIGGTEAAASPDIELRI
jgi:hypothetical protein